MLKHTSYKNFRCIVRNDSFTIKNVKTKKYLAKIELSTEKNCVNVFMLRNVNTNPIRRNDSKWKRFMKVKQKTFTNWKTAM